MRGLFQRKVGVAHHKGTSHNVACRSRDTNNKSLKCIRKSVIQTLSNYNNLDCNCLGTKQEYIDNNLMDKHCSGLQCPPDEAMKKRTLALTTKESCAKASTIFSYCSPFLCSC